MSKFQIAFKFFKVNKFQQIFNALLLALGIAILILTQQINRGKETYFEDNVGTIDLVIGAKGSPLQIILSSIFFNDFPTGNISYEHYENYKKNRLIKSAVPISMGDTYKGFKIIGTTADYIKIRNLEFAAGKCWDNEKQVVIGAAVAKSLKLSLGDSFSSQHGYEESGEQHEEHPFEVVGILKPSRSSNDRIILTSLSAYWETHHTQEKKEITNLYLDFKSPMASVMLPRQINQTVGLQGASPSMETIRLYNNIGVGITIFRVVAIVLLLLALGSFLLVSYQMMEKRKKDIKLFNELGYSSFDMLQIFIVETAFTMCTMLLFVFGIMAILVINLTKVDPMVAGYLNFTLENIFTLLVVSFSLLGLGVGPVLREV